MPTIKTPLIPPAEDSEEWKRARIPLRDKNGRIRVYVVHRHGQSHRDIQLAQEIADVSGFE